MFSLTPEIESALSPETSTLVKDLIYVGNPLRTARLAHADLEDVAADIEQQHLGFRLAIKDGEYPATKRRNPGSHLQQLGVNIDMFENRPAGKTKKVLIKGKGYSDIIIDGMPNLRDGASNTNWAVYKSISDGQGNITCAAIYIPNAGIVYLADQSHAQTINLTDHGIAGGIHELKIAPQLNDHFAGEYANWHRGNFAVPKAILTSLISANVGGSLRDTGMQQLPIIWVATGERGITMLGNCKPDTPKKPGMNMTGAFIAQKAGADVQIIPIESKNPRNTILVTHPDITEHVHHYFRQAMDLSRGIINPGTTKIYGAKDISHAR